MSEIPANGNSGLNGRIAGVSMPVVAIAMVLQLLGVQLPSQSAAPVDSPALMRQLEQTQEVLQAVRDALVQLAPLPRAISELKDSIDRRSRAVDRLVLLLEASFGGRSLPPWLPQPAP